MQTTLWLPSTLCTNAQILTTSCQVFLQVSNWKHRGIE